MENKQEILDKLAEVIRLTRAGDDLDHFEYDEKRELVFAFFDESKHASRIINVGCDSGWAMIKDVVNNLDIG